jgi:transposase InsO family protein
MTEPRKIPTLDVKLSGPSTYPEWVVSIETYLDLIPVSTAEEYRVWDIVMGRYLQPEPEVIKSTAEEGKKVGKAIRAWKDGNSVALLTIRKNCEDEVRARIGNLTNAKEAYEELKRAYEGRTTTEFYALLDSLTTSLVFDDRKTTVTEHITYYERTWNTFVGIISRADLTNDDGFGKGLKEFSKSDKAKAEFLLKSFPPFYSNTVENIRSKDKYGYDDIARKLKEYVPNRQKSHRSRTPGSSPSDDPIVLKTTTNTQDNTIRDNGKHCDYCIKVKKWKGIGHTEDDCRTKKREKKSSQAKAAKNESDSESDSDEEFVKQTTDSISDSNDEWFEFDTAATVHTTNQKHILMQPHSTSIKIMGHDGTKTKAELIGSVYLQHRGRTIELTEVYYHPKFSNLISGLVWEPPYSINDDGNSRRFYWKDNLVFEFEPRSVSRKLLIRPDEEKASAAKIDLQNLHERYGHISFRTISILPEAHNLRGGINYTCEACEKGKSTKPPAYKQANSIRTTRILQRIHADLVGPFRTEARGFRYMLVIMDDFSRYCTAIPLKTKAGTEVATALMGFIEQLETITSKKVTQIQADWGGEFRNKDIQQACTSKGISLKETIPHHSETNAAIERAIRTLTTIGRTILIASGLPKNQWADAIKFAAHIKNRMPHKALGEKHKSPLEILQPTTDIISERSNLRKYGEEVVVHNYKVTDKMAARSHRGFIVGYTNTHGIYWTIDKNQKRKLAKDPKAVSTDPDSDIEIPNFDEQLNITENSDLDSESSISNPKLSQIPLSNKEKPHRKTPEEFTALYGSRQSTRTRKPTKKVSENATVSAVGTDPDHPTDQQARQSQYSSEWAKAREKERAQLRTYGVYTVVNEIPQGITPVDTKWVYVIKRKHDGTIEKFKARKVGRGFTQQLGVNYDETYAQTMRAESLRIILIIALAKGWKIRQWDVVGAYLQATLKHDNIYVTDIDESGKSQHWKLHKALYGLKQSGHEWYTMLGQIMAKSNLQRCIADEGIFIPKATTFSNDEKNLVIGTWVDDLIAIAPSNRILDEIELSIEKHVELEKRGKPEKVLGMEVNWVSDCEIILTQTGLIENLAAAHGIHGVKHSLPIDPTYYEPDVSNPANPKTFQGIVGSLLYIARTTRPEISIHVNLLGRRTTIPSMTNLQTAKDICRYLLTTKCEGLRINPIQDSRSGVPIEVFVDASYGGEEARSQTGVLAMVAKQPVTWYSRRQDTVSLSITEAEYIACSEGAKDVSWMRQLLNELPPTRTTSVPSTLYTDNEAACKLTKNHMYHRRTRHIDHKYHYIRQEARSGNLVIKSVAGNNQLADPLTKLLPMSSIKAWKKTIGLTSSTPTGN